MFDGLMLITKALLFVCGLLCIKDFLNARREKPKLQKLKQKKFYVKNSILCYTAITMMFFFITKCLELTPKKETMKFISSQMFDGLILITKVLLFFHGLLCIKGFLNVIREKPNSNLWGFIKNKCSKTQNTTVVEICGFKLCQMNYSNGLSKRTLIFLHMFFYFIVMTKLLIILNFFIFTQDMLKTFPSVSIKEIPTLFTKNHLINLIFWAIKIWWLFL